MLNIIIGFAFLMVLLIPIGFFILSIIYATGEELRNGSKNKVKERKNTQDDEIPVRPKIRAVK